MDGSVGLRRLAHHARGHLRLGCANYSGGQLVAIRHSVRYPPCLLAGRSFRSGRTHARLADVMVLQSTHYNNVAGIYPYLIDLCGHE